MIIIFKEKVQIWWLRRRAKSLYLDYSYLFMSMDCGLSMALNISPTLYNLAVKFNDTMDRLAKLDPGAPERRLLT